MPHPSGRLPSPRRAGGRSPLTRADPPPVRAASGSTQLGHSGQGGARWASLERVTFLLWLAATPASDASGLYLCVSTGPQLCSNPCPVRREPPPRPGLGQARA